MAKSNGPVAKLRDKMGRQATAFRKGTSKGVVSRISESFEGGKHGREIAYACHRLLIERELIPDRSYQRQTTRALVGCPDEPIRGSKNWTDMKSARTNAERAKKNVPSCQPSRPSALPAPLRRWAISPR